MSKFKTYWKGIVEKPGASTHSEKWDRCVDEVKRKGNGANAYAVCTSMLGEESFKSIQTKEEFEASMQEYMRKLGISGAGPIPNSLMATQDLEGRREDVMTEERANEPFRLLQEEEMTNSTRKFRKAEGTFAVWYYDKNNARKCAVFPNEIDAQAYCRLIKNLGYKKIEILQKDTFDNAGKRLSEATEDAGDAETTREKNGLVNRIKNIQIQRQKGSIIARQKEGDAKNKSFKDVWNNSKK